MKVFLTIKEETTVITYHPSKRTNQISTRGDLDNVGVCRVSYRSKEYNEFEFDGREDFKNKFFPCVEPELLKFMGIK